MTNNVKKSEILASNNNQASQTQSSDVSPCGCAQFPSLMNVQHSTPKEAVQNSNSSIQQPQVPHVNARHHQQTHHPQQAHQQPHQQVPYPKKTSDLCNSSLLWRSKSFASGLETNNNYLQTFNPMASANIGLKNQIKARPVSMAISDNQCRPVMANCGQSCCPMAAKQMPSNHLSNVNNLVSQRYSDKVQMRHSQSHHSYLSNRTANNTSNLQNNTYHHTAVDATSLSSIGSSGSGSLSRGSTLINEKYTSLSNLSTKKFYAALSLNAKNGRVPQPERSLIIFTSIEKGLRECICLTQNDISLLRNSIDNGISFNSAQQYKTAERYLKRLEFQLAKVEELRDQYEMHIKMSEGVRSMALAYAFSPGKEKDLALSSVRIELQNYVQTMGYIETELEQSMGTLLLQMQGIQGFARLCAGDVFEITIRCGEKQKWKCKGKILKDNVQSWDSSEQLFRPSLSEQLSIKAVELKGLGKKLCLGSKNCEIKDLFLPDHN